jgi:nicotinamidase/pyrazinamidase
MDMQQPQDQAFAFEAGDALLVVDVQNDFLPGGALGVAGGDEIVPILNVWLERAKRAGVPVFATRDWHPPGHCSFRESGGPWPVHCVAGSPGARFSSALALPPQVQVISKATEPDREAYSSFAGTDMAARLAAAGVKRLFIGGLATDYCVVETTKDALALGYAVVLLQDAMCAIDPRDGEAAVAQMLRLGAVVAPPSAAADQAAGCG